MKMSEEIAYNHRSRKERREQEEKAFQLEMAIQKEWFERCSNFKAVLESSNIEDFHAPWDFTAKKPCTAKQ